MKSNTILYKFFILKLLIKSTRNFMETAFEIEGLEPSAKKCRGNLRNLSVCLGNALAKTPKKQQLLKNFETF